MKQEFKMSRTRFDELEKELNFLKTTRSDEVAEMIKVARGFGDLSENSEYDEAKNEQGKLYSRISELENILLHAVILEEGDMPTGQVTIGSTVTVTATQGGVSRSFKIVGSQEADAMHGIISEDSPFGKALMGRKEGDTVVVNAPAGDLEYRVDKIER
ncbi:MAG: transcription elongation factor GreA [Oscillospiraceae bacterium]|jgi:transcription elongation factor GreA|nr:transcription elongation factor GreA [Oscillospiraceae bacterium]MCI8758201.1 transcription elongation factor GreA [Oscillospiraceae bacterium]MCI9563921.1 transcription elongation factor GreA [Oscillospiraceae bacterium]